MPSFSEKKILPNCAKQVFDLVMDIESYPQFLPWCKQARIVEVISPINLHADLLISFKGFLEKYRSDVTFFQDEEGVYIIESIAIEGMFKKLYSKWEIKKIDENYCEASYYIDFSFNSFLLEKMVGLVFEKAARKMVKSFEDRLFAISQSS
jgi:coenzyme Q-binding protein COQ10